MIWFPKVYADRNEGISMIEKKSEITG